MLTASSHQPSPESQQSRQSHPSCTNASLSASMTTSLPNNNSTESNERVWEMKHSRMNDTDGTHLELSLAFHAQLLNSLSPEDTEDTHFAQCSIHASSLLSHNKPAHHIFFYSSFEHLWYTCCLMRFPLWVVCFGAGWYPWQYSGDLIPLFLAQCYLCSPNA